MFVIGPVRLYTARTTVGRASLASRSRCRHFPDGWQAFMTITTGGRNAGATAMCSPSLDHPGRPRRRNVPASLARSDAIDNKRREDDVIPPPASRDAIRACEERETNGIGTIAPKRVNSPPPGAAPGPVAAAAPATPTSIACHEKSSCTPRVSSIRRRPRTGAEARNRKPRSMPAPVDALRQHTTIRPAYATGMSPGRLQCRAVATGRLPSGVPSSVDAVGNRCDQNTRAPDLFRGIRGKQQRACTPTGT